MPNFAANLSMMYTEIPFLQRFEAAAADGFKAVEYLFPYEFSAQELSHQLKSCGLQQVLFNAPAGGFDKQSIADAWENSFRGTAALPGHEDEFKAGVELALTYAEKLNCPRIHIMAGLIPEVLRLPVNALQGLATSSNTAKLPGPLRDTYLNNIAWAAKQAASINVDVLIEPINTRDIPYFFLNRQEDAHAIIQETGCSNLKVQMDLYHCQIVEGDLASKIRAYLPTGRVAHFQIAGVPQRNEPDIGEVNYSYLFQVIDEVAAQCGWQGWVGCEYRPKKGGQHGGTSAGLGWLKGLL
jgi:hydroxypyruvate isomerase